VKLGYNVQTAVDTVTQLIVAHDVSNKGHDRHLLAAMAKEALQRSKLHSSRTRGTSWARNPGLPRSWHHDADPATGDIGQDRATVGGKDLRGFVGFLDCWAFEAAAIGADGRHVQGATTRQRAGLAQHMQVLQVDKVQNHTLVGAARRALSSVRAV